MSLCDRDDLWMSLEVAENLLAERVGELGVDPGVLDVLSTPFAGRGRRA